METILKHYLIAALWASTDDSGNPLDSKYDLEDIAQESKDKSMQDIKAFMEKAGDLIANIDEEQLGHDIFLTRNHHGAGFWDRDYSPYKDAETEQQKELLLPASKLKGEQIIVTLPC